MAKSTGIPKHRPAAEVLRSNLLVALSDLASGNYVIYRRVLAGAFAATVPLLILLLIGGRQIVRGIMEGAVKS